MKTTETKNYGLNFYSLDILNEFRFYRYCASCQRKQIEVSLGVVAKRELFKRKSFPIKMSFHLHILYLRSQDSLSALYP